MSEENHPMYNKRELLCDCIISTGGDSKAAPSTFDYPVKYKAKFTSGSMRNQDPENCKFS